MLKVELAAVKPGMELAMPVSHPRHPTRVLLRAGYALEHAAIRRLLEMRIRSVWVRYPSLAALENFIDPHVIAAQAEVVEQIMHTFEQVQRGSCAKLPYAAYCRSVGELISNLVGNPKAALFIGELAEYAGDDLMRHSSAVTYLSLLMGLKLEGYLVRQRRQLDPAHAREVTNLGIGAMLHDLGITALDEAVVRQYRQSGDESNWRWRQHPWLGYEMVKGRVEPTAANIVMHHHQRFDGSGYGGRTGEPIDGMRIHVFTRIVGLAEAFDRMRHPVSGAAQPTARALARLLDPEVLRQFDPEVVRALFSVTPAYPPGSMVTLSDGRPGVVIDHHPLDPCRPIVQVLDCEAPADDPEATLGDVLDLSRHHAHLRIITCDGQDVADLHFSLPKHLRGEWEWAMRA